jgi:diadenosine tetraphosphate (Ap4A) HIT family hydrolase
MGADCPFGAIGCGEVDADLVAFRVSGVFVVPLLKQRPSNLGQVLVCPVAHEALLHRLELHVRSKLFDVVAQVVAAAPRAFGAVGTTVLMNNGAPDQELDHLHIHVIPRFDHDALVIPNADTASAPRDLRLELASKLRSELE